MKRLRFLWVSVLGSLLLFTPQTANAGWMRTYGGLEDDFGYSIQKTADSGYVVVGITKSFSSNPGTIDLWLIKIDENGNTLWTRTYGGPKEDYGYFIQQTSDGGYIITGNVNATALGTLGDLWLLKTDSLGDSVWSRSYGMEGLSDRGKYVYEMESEGYMVFGETESQGAGEEDVWILRTDDSGDTLWTKTYGEENIDHLDCVQLTGQLIKGYVMLVQSYTMKSQLVRIDTSGQIYSADRVQGGNIGYIQENWWGGGYLCLGWWSPSPDDPSDVFLGKTDAFLPEIYEWVKMWGGEGVQEGTCVENDHRYDTYIVTGVSCRTDECSELMLSKVGADTFNRFFGGVGVSYGTQVLPTSDGGYIVLGSTNSFGAGKYDIWLIKTDSLGYVDVKEESHTQVNGNWTVVTSIGPKIVLRYTDRPEGFHASIFDATGRKVDELHSSNASGTITWGEGISPGVYFIRAMNGLERSNTSRVIIIH